MGWIKLHRKLAESAVFLDAPLLKLWVLCLFTASHKNIYVKVDGIVEPIELKPGQFITGRFKLHGDYHQWRRGYEKRSPSPRTVWRWLEKLRNLQMLTIKSFSKYSIITITNWDQYQGFDQQMTTNKKCNDKEGRAYQPFEENL